MFDHESARAARIENPKLTVFDTGEMLEPIVTTDPTELGAVDFTNDSSEHILSVSAHPSTIEDNCTTVELDTYLSGRVKVVLNDVVLGIFELD